MARSGVQSIKAEPDGLYGHGGTEGVATCVMVPWEDVPYEVRQHLAEVYKYLNQVTLERTQDAAFRMRESKINKSWVSEVA